MNTAKTIMIVLCAAVVALLGMASCDSRFAMQQHPVDYCSDTLSGFVALPSEKRLSSSLDWLTSQAQTGFPCPLESSFSDKTLKIRVHLKRDDLRHIVFPLAIPWDDPILARSVQVKWDNAYTTATLEQMGCLRTTRVARLDVEVPIEPVSEPESPGSFRPNPCRHGEMSICFETQLRNHRVSRRPAITEYGKALSQFVANPGDLEAFAAPSLETALSAPVIWRPSGKFRTIIATSETLCFPSDSTGILYDQFGSPVPATRSNGVLSFRTEESTSPYTAKNVYFLCEGGKAVPEEPVNVRDECLTTVTLKEESEVFVKTDRFQSILGFRRLWHDFEKTPRFSFGFAAPARLRRGDVPVTMMFSFADSADENTSMASPLVAEIVLNKTKHLAAVDPLTSRAILELPPAVLLDRNGLEIAFPREKPHLLLDKIQLVFRAFPGSEGKEENAAYECLTNGCPTGKVIHRNGVHMKIIPQLFSAKEPKVPQSSVVFIAHPDFIPTLEKYVEDKTSIVNIKEIYDYYSFGVETPLAVRDYLRHVLAVAKTPPDYAVLVGDCTVDYRGVLENGIGNFVPSMCVRNSDGSQGASDRYFGDLCGQDQLIDLFISRLSVRTQADLEAYLEKARSYRSPKAFANHAQAKSKMLFVADQEEQFEQAVDSLQQSLLPGYERETLKLADFPWIDNWYYPDALADRKQLKTSPQATKRLLQLINDGAATLTYFGHGSPNIWSNERLWFGGESENSDNKLLNNPDALPFLTAFSCNVGAIDYPLPRWNVCITEDMLRQKKGGIIGAYVPSGPGLVSEHTLLARNILLSMQSRVDAPIGANIGLGEWRFLTESHGNTSGDLLPMYNLLGLPNLKLHLMPDMNTVLQSRNGVPQITLACREQDLGAAQGTTVVLTAELVNPHTYPIFPKVKFGASQPDFLLPPFLPNEKKTLAFPVIADAMPGTFEVVPFDGIAPGATCPKIHVFGEGGAVKINAGVQTVDTLHGDGFSALFETSVVNETVRTLTTPTLTCAVGGRIQTSQPLESLKPGNQMKLLTRIPFGKSEQTTEVLFQLTEHGAAQPVASRAAFVGTDMLCDVSVTSSSIAPESPTEGETFYVNIDVRNLGRSVARGITVALKDEVVTTRPVESRGAPRVPKPFDLEPGQIKSLTLRVDPFQNAGEQRVNCRINPANAEFNTANNSVSQTVKVRTKARLRPSGMRLERTSDGKRALNIIVGVENRGESPAYGVMVQVYNADEKGRPVNIDEPIGDAMIGVVPPKTRIEQSVRYDIPDTRSQGTPLRFTYEVFLKGSAQRVRPD